ncbi:MAG: 50S ribosomal protein L29 [Verrucomicrobiales bacterium]|nr:50S ribosomal protein L29 [Verrucomicrobiales bacterium]HCU87118.1 50S ribosomal protein L29 [Verrucomicrobiales bacterium]
MAMKIDEIKEMPAVELQAKGRELREELFQLNMQNSQGLLEKPHRIRDLRRDIAKVETLLSQKRNEAAAA